MKSQMELAEDIAIELTDCGHEDISALDILDAIASSGIALIESTYFNLASEEMLASLGGIND